MVINVQEKNRTYALEINSQRFITQHINFSQKNRANRKPIYLTSRQLHRKAGSIEDYPACSGLVTERVDFSGDSADQVSMWSGLVAFIWREPIPSG